MLHWQHKNREQNSKRLQKIIKFSVGIHLILFFCTFFVVTDDVMHVAMNIPAHARIVCLPSFMLPQQPNSRLKIMGALHKGSKYSSTIPQKTLAVKKIAKKPITKITQATKTIERKKLVQLKKLVQKKLSPAFLKKMTDREVIVPKQPEPIEQPTIETPSVVQKPEEQMAIAEQNSAEELVVYIDKNMQQSLAVGQELREAIAQEWAPPLGIADDTSCDVQVTVDAQGKAELLTVVKKSGIAVFDMAARTAVSRAKYPKSVWGKTIVIHFG